MGQTFKTVTVKGLLVFRTNKPVIFSNLSWYLWGKSEESLHNMQALTKLTKLTTLSLWV